MITIADKKIGNTPQVAAKKIIEIWFRGYMLYPDSKIPDEVRKYFKSCFAMGEWWSVYDWTDDLNWANDIEEAIINYDERDGI